MVKTQWQIKTNGTIDEKFIMHRWRRPELYVLPHNGYNKNTLFFHTFRLDRQYLPGPRQRGNDQEEVVLPDGVAHF